MAGPVARSCHEDDLWDWENNSTIDYIQQLQRTMKSWKPQPSEMTLHNDKLTQTGQLTMERCSCSTAIRRGLGLAMSLVRADPIGVGLALPVPSLLDTGQWHDAKSVLDELIKSDSKDPRVQALAVIFGYGTKGRAP